MAVTMDSPNAASVANAFNPAFPHPWRRCPPALQARWLQRELILHEELDSMLHDHDIESLSKAKGASQTKAEWNSTATTKAIGEAVARARTVPSMEAKGEHYWMHDQ